jgi:hypothetical protein
MSDDDRALISRKTPARGVEFIPEEVTGVYEGEELARFRSRRPTDERIGRVEVKLDRGDERLGALEQTVAKMDGKLDTVLDFIKSDRDNTHQTERIRIGSRAKVIIAIVGAIGTAIGVVGTMLAGCV